MKIGFNCVIEMYKLDFEMSTIDDEINDFFLMEQIVLMICSLKTLRALTQKETSATFIFDFDFVLTKLSNLKSVNYFLFGPHSFVRPFRGLYKHTVEKGIEIASEEGEEKS